MMMKMLMMTHQTFPQIGFLITSISFVSPKIYFLCWIHSNEETLIENKLVGERAFGSIISAI